MKSIFNTNKQTNKQLTLMFRLCRTPGYLDSLNVYYFKHGALSSTCSSPVEASKWQELQGGRGKRGREVGRKKGRNERRKEGDTHAASSSCSVGNRLILKPVSVLGTFSAFTLPISRASRFSSSLASGFGVSSSCRTCRRSTRFHSKISHEWMLPRGGFCHARLVLDRFRDEVPQSDKLQIPTMFE